MQQPNIPLSVMEKKAVQAIATTTKLTPPIKKYRPTVTEIRKLQRDIDSLKDQLTATNALLERACVDFEEVDTRYQSERKAKEALLLDRNEKQLLLNKAIDENMRLARRVKELEANLLITAQQTHNIYEKNAELQAQVDAFFAPPPPPSPMQKKRPREEEPGETLEEVMELHSKLAKEDQDLLQEIAAIPFPPELELYL